MGVIFKAIIGCIIIVGIFTAFSAIFPQDIASGIDGAIIYFFSFINGLGTWFHVSTLMSAIGVLASYILGVCIYLIIKMFYHMIT